MSVSLYPFKYLGNNTTDNNENLGLEEISTICKLNSKTKKNIWHIKLKDFSTIINKKFDSPLFLVNYLLVILLKALHKLFFLNLFLIYIISFLGESFFFGKSLVFCHTHFHQKGVALLYRIIR